MCGRFALKAPPRTIQEHFQLPETIELPKRYNIAPSQNIAVVRSLPGQGARQLDMLRWGLVPSWAKDLKIGYKMINARSETLAQKPSFRAPFKNKRCLIVADGFYEWKRSGKVKQPYYIHLAGNSVLAFAGLWESWHSPDGQIIESCTIITTIANRLVSEIHDRMPVILPPGQYETWLQNSSPGTALHRLLVPYPDDEMEVYQVGQAVNSPKNETPECVEPIRTLF